MEMGRFTLRDLQVNTVLSYILKGRELNSVNRADF